MATAIEYGLIAALIGVAGITAASSLGPEMKKFSEPAPAVSRTVCTSFHIRQSGRVSLTCPDLMRSDLEFYADDTDLALKLALRPRRVVCDLYTNRPAKCSPA